MKAITFGALIITATIVSFGTSAQAQSEASSLSGTSLVGIDNRNAQDDFTNFFGVVNSDDAQPNTLQNNAAATIEFNQTLTLPDTPIYLQPAQQSLGGTDGVQVQVDFRNLDRPTQNR
ncbi:MAG: hypothetical protein IGS39_04935 [Calothrix sp. C42_A2020_038]|nr:hypothetical protein [Calothrix sp. C42_A2020_038]